MDNKFKVLALAIVVVFAVALVAGFVYLEGAGRPTSSFVIFAASLFGPLVAGAGLAYGQKQNSEKLDSIGRNVNGNVTRLLDVATGGEPLTDSERAKIERDLGMLPSHDDYPPRHARG